MRKLGHTVAAVLLLAGSAMAAQFSVSGRVLDTQGYPVPGATVQLIDRQGSLPEQTKTNEQGGFEFQATASGDYVIAAAARGFEAVEETLAVAGAVNLDMRLGKVRRRNESVTVTADVNESDVLSPDPGEKVFVREDLLGANPGRPGAPVSLPGYPIETASSGIKAPQYFAPGVAGDHGEPIAQYIALGSELIPNNLSANAHGNGYADPNLFIPEILESVKVDGGAFDVRQGNHSVNLAATYGLRSRIDPFLSVTGDYRDIDLAAGFSPTPESWLALEGSYGNGFLDRLEHRQQYKLNGQRLFHVGEHRLTLLGIGYYGQSYIPGLVPIRKRNAFDAGVANLGDTIDPRQKDQTHTALIALNDVWQLSSSQQLQLSGFFRTYDLALYSDFGQGLIRQSEFRTVTGGTANYVNRIAESLSLLGGLDYARDAPRRDDLDHYGFFNASQPDTYGPFTPVAGNNVTIRSATPYLAAEGALARHFRYYLGWRRDQIDFDNQDLLHSENSFQKRHGVNSPKATVSFLPKESWYVPLVSLSFGQAFFTEDPRIGAGNAPGTPVAIARSYQLVASQTIHNTDVRFTLGRVSNSSELAKIDPDTGLQFDQGPSRLRFMTVSVRRNLGWSTWQASFSKADARDLDSGEPTPEAPRTIFDLLGTTAKLPFGLQAKGEFAYVGAKPLGTGCDPVNPTAECTGIPVKEFRGALVRPCFHGRLDAGVNFLLASGAAGQTTESFFPSEIQEVVGVRIPSSASVTLAYRFGRAATP
jgi:hypothetical protein